MTLPDWLNSNWVVEHVATKEEIAGLLAVADRDLADAQAQGLSTDWRFNIAYNATLQLAQAALLASGYRTVRGGPHHHRVIQSLALTVGADARTVQVLNRFRKKRNLGQYELAGIVSEQEAGEMFSLAKSMKKDVRQWLRVNHPELL